MRFSRQEHWSGLPFPSPGDLHDPRIGSVCPVSPALQADSLSTKPLGKPCYSYRKELKSGSQYGWWSSFTSGCSDVRPMGTFSSRDSFRKSWWKLPANARDANSIPGSGRSTGRGNGNPLQYSCLENPTDREAWWATIHGVAKSWTWLKWLIIYLKHEVFILPQSESQIRSFFNYLMCCHFEFLHILRQ